MRFIAIILLLSACASEDSTQSKSYGKTFQQCVSDEQCVDLDIADCATSSSNECAVSPLGVAGKCVMGRCQPSRN